MGTPERPDPSASLLSRLGLAAADLAERTIPDPFVIAIGLSAIAVGAAWAGTGSAVDAAQAFTGGMFQPALLAFGFKMALILVTGHALAAAPAVRRGLQNLAGRPQTSAAAAGWVALLAMTLGLLNWGLGLVGGAFFAREVGRAFRAQGRSLNYPLVGAAGYLGLLVWHGGLSGSATLKVAKPSELGDALPISETIFSPMNLVITMVLLIAIPLLFRGLGSSGASKLTDWPELEPPPPETPPERAPLSWLEGSIVVAALLGVPIATALGAGLVAKAAGAVNLDFVILAFWLLGLAAHRSPVAYGRAFSEGARGAGGILLQFPLYFGILAAGRASGALEWMASTSNAVAASMPVDVDLSAPILTFVSAGAINMLVPSGGGQWVLQAPMIAKAVAELGVDRAEMVMAFCYGDQITNMLQPFWALPLLSITGLKARELMGYTLLAMLAAAPLFVLALAVF